MAQKKAVIAAMAFLVTSLLVVGALALAAELGSKEDPLVPLSYLSGLEPQLKAKIDEMAAQTMAEYDRQLEDKLAAARQELEKLVTGSLPTDISPEVVQSIVDEVLRELPAASANPQGSVPATYTRVDIPANKTVTFGIGATFCFRSGTASIFKDKSPGLIDLTEGAEQNDGALKVNHLYMATFDNTKGFKTSADSIIFVLGSYKIS